MLVKLYSSIIFIVLIQVIGTQAIAQAQQSAIPTKDTTVRLYQLDRELEEKKDELRTKKIALGVNKSVTDIISQAIAKVNQSQYPNDLAALLVEAQSLAKNAKKKSDIELFFSKLQIGARKYNSARIALGQLIDLEDSTLSIEEKKILRPMVIAASAQLSELVKPRRFSLNFPIEMLLDDPSSELKKAFPNFPTTFVASTPGLQEVISEYTAEKFNTYKDRVLQALGLMQKQLSQASADGQKTIELIISDIDRLSERVEKARERGSKVDEALIYFSLPGLGLLMIGLLLAPRIYKNDNLHFEVFKSGLLLELFTVFLITATILILGLGQRIDGPILGTLLSGIAGYVLGRAGAKDPKLSSNDRTNGS